MPITLAHPVAAWAATRTGLPLTAVVAGTVVPDVPLFARSADGYASTHSLTGVLSGDLVLGVGLVVLWLLVVRDALVDASPTIVRDRLPATARPTAQQWCLVPVAVVLGSASHVGWDEFTHVDRWGYRHLAWLRTEHAGWTGYHWAQAVSSVLGLLGVVVWALAWLHARPVSSRPPLVPMLAGRGWIVVAAVGVVTAVTGMIRLDDGLHRAAFAAAVIGIVTGAVAVLVAALGWRLALARARTGIA